LNSPHSDAPTAAEDAHPPELNDSGADACSVADRQAAGDRADRRGAVFTIELPVTTEPQRLETAVRGLLIEKGVFSGSDLHGMLEAIDSWTPALGARMVARAWVDPAYKARLLSDGASAARELGVEPGPAQLVVLENTPARHNLVVCTLCSCYPKRVLGIPPDWYKSREYRFRAVRQPTPRVASHRPTRSGSHTPRNTAPYTWTRCSIAPAGLPAPANSTRGSPAGDNTSSRTGSWLATAGTPACAASTPASPKVSARLGKTNAASALSRIATRSGASSPRKWTRSAQPSSRAGESRCRRAANRRR